MTELMTKSNPVIPAPIYTASQAMIVDLTTSENRRVVYSIQYWIINFAIMIGSGLSGWFFRDYLVWLLLAITIEEIVSCLVVIFWIDESFNPDTQQHKQESNIIKAYFTVAKDRIFMYYLFASVFIAMIFNQIDYYLPVHLSDSFRTARIFGIEVYGQRMLTIFLMVTLNTINDSPIFTCCQIYNHRLTCGVKKAKTKINNKKS